MEMFWVVVLIFAVLVIAVLCIIGYIYVIKDKMTYKKAKKEIFAYVKSYQSRRSGNNRFQVTVDVLQDAFREYDTVTINKVWLELIDQRIIEKDPHDNEWCVR